MPRTTGLSRPVFALCLTCASPALGVTAPEVWAEWQAQSATLGQVVTVQDVVPGDGTLILRGFDSRFDDGTVATRAQIDEIVMTEAADGSVIIDPSDVYTITLSFAPNPGSQRVNLGINLIAPDLMITVSGDAGARIYEYQASQITVEDGPLSGGNGQLPVIDLRLGVQDLAGTYQIDTTDLNNIAYSSSSTFGGITGAIDVTPPPGEEGRLKLAFSLGASTGNGGGRLGNMLDLAANPNAIPAGFDLGGAFSYASASVDVTFQHPTDAFNLFAANDGGTLSGRFSENAMDYRLTTTGSSTYFNGPDLPVPVDFSVASAEIAFRVPLSAAPEPQPLAARLAYQDVMISPEIWALADPAGAFPRDPITVIADVSGTAQMMADLLSMDPSMMGAPPGELRQLSLNDLRVSIGGATLTGDGAATFAPGQGAGPGSGPVPMPVGAVNLRLAGANALMDRLQSAGVFPIEQIAMARGLLGAFTRPGTAPDTVESTIQFTQGGGITANGVPLQ